MNGVFKASCPKCGQVTARMAEECLNRHPEDAGEIIGWLKQGKRVEYTTETVTLGRCVCRAQIGAGNIKPTDDTELRPNLLTLLSEEYGGYGLPTAKVAGRILRALEDMGYKRWTQEAPDA